MSIVNCEKKTAVFLFNDMNNRMIMLEKAEYFGKIQDDFDKFSCMRRCCLAIYSFKKYNRTDKIIVLVKNEMRHIYGQQGASFF